MRILCVAGADAALRIPFLTRLTERGHAVVALTSGAPGPFAAAGIECLSYALHRFVHPTADLATIMALGTHFRRLRPDLIHSFDTKPGLYAPLATLGNSTAPVVRTVNGAGYLFSDRSLNAALLRAPGRALQRLVAARIACNVFQNDDDRRLFVDEGFTRPERCRLITGSGIDLAAFAAALPRADERSSLRRQLGLDGRRVVVTVSRLTRQKGIGTLLHAAQRVCAQLPDVSFLLVGPREEEGPLAIPAAELERHRPYVTWLGQRDDVPSLLALADLFVLPTEYREGVPRVLLEAGAARLPVIATAMPGCTDVVCDGRTGLLVPPGDPARLAATIVACLGRPEMGTALAAGLHDEVARHHELDGIVGQYEQVYAEVVAGPRPRRSGWRRRLVAVDAPGGEV